MHDTSHDPSRSAPPSVSNRNAVDVTTVAVLVVVGAGLALLMSWRGVLQRGIDELRFGLTELLTDAPRPTTLAAAARTAAPRPILLIAAERVDDEVHAAEHIRRAAPESVSVWTVADAGHTDGLEVTPEEWTRRVTEFLDGALLDAP